MERCPSGLWCDLGRVVWGQLHREFESHPLCIKPSLALLVLGFILGNGFGLQINTWFEKNNREFSKFIGKSNDALYKLVVYRLIEFNL